MILVQTRMPAPYSRSERRTRHTWPDDVRLRYHRPWKDRKVHTVSAFRPPIVWRTPVRRRYCPRLRADMSGHSTGVETAPWDQEVQQPACRMASKSWQFPAQFCSLRADGVDSYRNPAWRGLLQAAKRWERTPTLTLFRLALAWTVVVVMRC